MHKIAQLPSYDDVEQTSANIGFPFGGAECHGLASGIISATDNTSHAKKILVDLLTNTNAAVITTAAAKTLLIELCDITAAQLADINFSFQLLLPGDDVSLTIRSEAISAWCQGFISGLGEGRAGSSLNAEPALAEMIRDLTAIAQIDMQTVNGTEDEEISFTELVEYLRFAAMTTYTDLLLTNKNTMAPNTPQQIH